MAYIAFLNLCTTTSTTRSNTLSSACPLYKQRSQVPTITRSCLHKVSCRSREKGESSSLGRINRRNILIGLGGGLCTATGLGGLLDLSNSEAAELITTNYFSPKVVDFKFPSPSSLMRTRPAVHLLDEKYITKYNKAISLMNALPADDPRNCKQQTSIHCVYGHAGHNQVCFPGLELQIQNYSLLLPWHRWYLYFNEKILGKLIGDHEFAIPFWSWDTPKEMQLPRSLGNLSFSLYNDHCSPNLHPPTTIDLDMIDHEPIFFAYHSNIDRIWATSNRFGGSTMNFADQDWLNTTFLFYDENAQLVRVKVADCLEPMKLCYTYQDVEMPWLTVHPTARKAEAMTASEDAVKPNKIEFPVTLNSVTKFTVQRPKKRRSKREKEEEEEILVIEGRELDRELAIKFDVYINDKEDKALGPIASEFAGSFINVPQKIGKRTAKMKRTQLKLGITDLLEEIDGEGDESILVSLVPRKGKGEVRIGGIKIEFGS